MHNLQTLTWPGVYFLPLLSVPGTAGTSSLPQFTPKQNQKSKEDTQLPHKRKTKIFSPEAWRSGEKGWWPLRTGAEDGRDSRGMRSTPNRRNGTLLSARPGKEERPSQGLQGTMSWTIWQLEKQLRPPLGSWGVGRRHIQRLGAQEAPGALTPSAPLHPWEPKKPEVQAKVSCTECDPREALAGIWLIYI